MERELSIFVGVVVLYLLWVVAPLIPAIVTYRMFPDTQVATEGPLSGLTFKATGAFAAYIVVLVLMYPFSLKLHDLFSDQIRTVWTIKARVVASDETGKAIEYDDFYQGMDVSFKPEFQIVSGRKVELKIPLEGGRSLPKITFTVPNYGGATIDPEEFKDRYEVDSYNKQIIIHDVIPLERIRAGGIGVVPSAL